jgi:AcrR family transcriptional regulator
MNKVIEKHELVDIAANLFRMKGYSGTSIDDIAKACGLTKGSLYHHFSGKEELAAAALEQVHQYYREHIFSIVRQCDKPGVKELEAFNHAVEDFFIRHPHGCLLANLSLELGGAFELFGKKIKRFFNEWIDCYAKVFAHHFPSAEANARAEDAVAIVQGCILMNRIRRNLDPLRRQHMALVAACRKSKIRPQE